MTHNRDKTHCIYGHPLSGDNLYVSPEGYRECRACRRTRPRAPYIRKGRYTTHCYKGHEFSFENTLFEHTGRGRMQRRCKICREAQRGVIPLEKVRVIIEGLHHGKTIFEIENVDKTVHKGQTRAFGLKNPKLGKRIFALSTKNRLDRMRELWDARRSIAPALQRNDSDAFPEIMRVTAGLADDIREDVQSRMWLAVAERRLKIRDIARRLPEFVRDERRMFSKFVPVVGGLMGSLDAKIYDDGEMTVGDTVTRGLWD